ncbi:Rad51 [Popillia japonica]|uniref:Rad51 n=1 Tax=Popillia japonica TaxID=7064 RepID=A0AAW1LBG0_POPJA
MSRLSTKTHPLLTESVIDNLFSKQIFTVTNYIDTDVKRLVNITNLTYKNVLTIRKHIINKNAAVVKNGLSAFEEWLDKNALLQTGIQNIDSILNGGLSTGHVYELCGLPASGKTQFCLTVTMNIAQKLKQHVYYLDCKGDFNATRIKSMLDARKVTNNDTIEIMSKILVKRINTLYELVNSLYQIKTETNNGLNVKLIVVDSLPALAYQFEEFSKCNSALNHLVNVMKFLTSEYYVCFVVTNILTTWYEGNIGEEKLLSEKIGSGKYWQSVPNTRLKFVSGEVDGKYEISIVKSNEIITGTKCYVRIGDVGMM